MILASIATILEFLAGNKVLVAAVATICELIVIIANTIRRIYKKEPPTNLMVSAKSSKKAVILWVINPLNLFRKP